ncbi:DNA-directed RNA polymerase subunit beta [Mesomycoplasma bovoculi]|uniref:DNA-directed RNA polymerase subunit beta n=2 Tax=Mesomycoplasma bovoculi M165/69 TaxID=743966 RepID=W5UTA5_9BACT|nr:DNA-directed RNA polymerase subunit beta [Mesomycoplasma bovoculi]AHH45045.1 DNA-directed RNA polymerase subunit beta [Mesomycoplasma bovoculi M165/69]
MNHLYSEKTYGLTTKRRFYAKTKQTLTTPNFLDSQRDSYHWFLEEGITEAFNKIYPVFSTNGKLEISFKQGSIRVERPKDEFSSIREARQKGKSYVCRVYATLRKIQSEDGEVEEQEILLGEIPYMTQGGTFIINGFEKIVISQLIRSPGVCYRERVRNRQADDLFNKVEIIPQLGSWIEIFHKVTGHGVDTVKIRIDKHKNIPLITFLKAFGFVDETIKKYFGQSAPLLESLKKHKVNGVEENLEQIYRIIRKDDRITEEGLKNFIPSIIFNERRYNLSKTGRYMLNNKLNLIERITQTYLAQDLIDKNGDLVYAKKTFITRQMAVDIQKKFEDGSFEFSSIDGIDENVYGRQLQINRNTDLSSRTKVISVKVWPNKRAMSQDQEPILVIGNDPTSNETTLLISDIVAIVSYYFNLISNIGKNDDPDSLINKRIVGVGELLQNQFLIALNKMEKNTKERISSRAEIDKITVKSVINNKPIYNQFKNFFNSSKLSQFMDQINPLGEMASKRRVTSLGPGGLNRETAQFEVRDVHATHYGRICPVETPEGQNIGLILNYSVFAKTNPYGFILTPYFKVNNRVVDYSQPHWLTAAEEFGLTFAQSSLPINEKNEIIADKVTVRKNQTFIVVDANEIDYIDVSSMQMTSISASAIPFLENNDANRALMGSNMQRQAVPLIKAESPFVATGIESDVALYSSTNIRSETDGVVTFVDSKKIIVTDEEDNEHTYYLRHFEKSNQETLILQKPIVSLGQQVKKGQLICDGPSTDKGELALGKNVLVAFTTWNGYNYEDAIIISERLVKDDVFTSIHIQEQTIKFRSTKAGTDILTAEVPNTSAKSRSHLDANGIVRVGSEVNTGDILVGRTSPKGEDNPTPEDRLIVTIWGKKALAQKDTSLRVKHGEGGTVIDVQVLSRENGDTLEDGVGMLVKVLIAQKRKIKVGDKMAGRHGNKGVVSIVLPVEDMPFLEDGTPVDILLNPQGVPSRMNIGQVLELHLGMVAKNLNTRFVTPVFDGIKPDTMKSLFQEASMPESGKFKLYDGITGKAFDKEVSVGYMYMLKLQHMVDDKMHARAVGPYSLTTQQPLGGKSQNGGQRFGEMETWALESFGATTVLSELLTYKSDNIVGRNSLYNNLISGGKLPRPGTPESFNVLAYELRGLLIKLEVHKKENANDAEFDVLAPNKKPVEYVDHIEDEYPFDEAFSDEGRTSLESDFEDVDEENEDFDEDSY